MHFENPSFPFSNIFHLFLSSPIGSSDELCFRYIHPRTVHAALRAEPRRVGVAHRSSGVLECVEDFLVVAVEHEEGAGGDAGDGVSVSEEEETLVGAVDFEAVEAGEGGVGAEVPVALPDFVGVGGSDFSDEGNHGALKVKRDLHVEITHAAESRHEARQAAAPLRPGGAVVEPDEHLRDFGGAPAERLLERVPAGGVVEGDVGAGGGDGPRGGDVVEADSEVERRLPEWDVAAVEHGRDFLGDSLLSERVGLGDDSGRVGNSGKRRNDSGKLCVVANRHRVVNGAV